MISVQFIGNKGVYSAERCPTLREPENTGNRLERGLALIVEGFNRKGPAINQASNKG